MSMKSLCKSVAVCAVFSVQFVSVSQSDVDTGAVKFLATEQQFSVIVSVVIRTGSQQRGNSLLPSSEQMLSLHM